MPTRVLIDSGCSLTLIHEDLAASLSLPRRRCCLRLLTMGGGAAYTRGSVNLRSLLVDGMELGPTEAFVMANLPSDVGLVLGLDVILRCGIQIRKADGEVSVVFGGSCLATEVVPGQPLRMNIEDEDFQAMFKGGRWIVRWKWNGNGVQDSVPKSEFVKECDREAFDGELNDWLEEGILVPYDKSRHGSINNYLPLIAVRQTKGSESKVRPVLDYRSLNKAVQSHPGGATPICIDLLRAWRQKGGRCSIMDLRRAYLQVCVDPELWSFQAVRWNGKDYLLTRLGFGLASAPKIMTRIVEAVTGADDQISASVSSYIDDLYVVEGKVTAAEVREHFSHWGLTAKPPEYIGSQKVRILGLRVNEQLDWTRDGDLPSIPEKPTRREVHRIVGAWIGHYPIGGWLRVASGYIQRQAASEGIGWDDKVSSTLHARILEVDRRLRCESDPVRGYWLVDGSAPMKIWADASSIAIGVILEVGDNVVEDAAWMRPKDDPKHINCAELDAVIRGLNMALRWGRRELLIMTDSSTVFGWLSAVIKKTHNVRTRSLSEVIIRRRLDILTDILSDPALTIDVKWVKSADNKADRMTRVPNNWLKLAPDAATLSDIRVIHSKCHFGIQRTHELASERYGDVPIEMVKEVVYQCQECSRVDPAARFSFDRGKITANSVWEKLAIDLTHVGNGVYLSVIDVFSGYAIWSKLNNESGLEVVHGLLRVFSAFGPPKVVLSDNGTVFRGKVYQELLSEWEVQAQQSCAYRPQGNGVAERAHRTIKRSVKRSGRPVEYIVFWHNNTRGCRKLSPYEMVFGMTSLKPGVSSERHPIKRDFTSDVVDEDLYDQLERNPFVVGDKVYLRPPSGKCDEDWSGPHTVTDLRSNVSAVINDDGVSRHVSYLRLVPGSRGCDSSEISYEEEPTIPCGDGNEVRRSSRMRERPVWWRDYEVEV